MKRLCGILLLVLSPIVGAAEDKPAKKIDKGSLKAYILKTQSRQAYGVYLGKSKVGWMIAETKVVRRDGKEVVLSSEEAFFSMNRGDEKLTMEMKNVTTFGLDGKGEILSIEERSRQNKNATVRRAVPQGGKFVITTEINGRKTQRTVPRPRKNLLAARQLDDWLRGNPAKGATFASWSTSINEDEINSREVYTFLSKKKIAWGGVPTDVYHIRILDRGVRTEGDIKSDGTIIRGRIGALMELRAEPEATARKLDAKSIDMMQLSSIPSNKDLGRPAQVSSLTLEILNLEDYAMPTSHRQKVRREKGGVLLELRRDFRTGKTIPLSKKQRARYLQATHTIQSDKDKVKKLAARIVGTEKDPLKVAHRLKTWVYRNLRQTMAANASTTLEVLDNMAGDCTEHTLLFVSLARAAGLPAREVGGVAYANIGRPLFGWHAWAEIHDGSQWVTVDPTWNQLYVDATHVKFSEGDDMAWLNVLGKVKFKVLKFEKK